METKLGTKLEVATINWQEAITQIEQLHPKLAQIMENLSDPNQVFYKATYRFGDTIIRANELYLPLQNGGVISFDDKQVPARLQKDLAYDKTNEDPVGLILTKESEFYMASGERILSHGIANPGYILGIPRAIHEIGHVPLSSLSWDLNAGSRSLFMLSPVNNKIHHANLEQHCGIEANVPTHLKDHWQVFVDIANKVKADWKCEILYFPREFINKLRSSKFSELSMHLTQIHRSNYNVLHNTSTIWNNTFSEIEQERRLGIYPMYSVATAKHMFIIAAKSSPAFKPATNDNSAPIQLLREVYSEIYGLNTQGYSSVIMEPTLFDYQLKQPVYYSLNYPTFAQNNLELSRKKSQISLLDEIRGLIDIYQNTILKNKEHVKSLYNIANRVKFSYYHSSPENYRHIENANTIIDDDDSFLKEQTGNFPSNSQFFKGCIKIASR